MWWTTAIGDVKPDNGLERLDVLEWRSIRADNGRLPFPGGMELPDLGEITVLLVTLAALCCFFE